MSEHTPITGELTATDELRRLLDERGVEWKAPASYDGSNRFDTVVGENWFHEYDGRITVHGLTPEQAIAATLGMGVNCSKAEHDAGGCLGFQSGDDDEPVEQCKACHRYTSWEVEP